MSQRNQTVADLIPGPPNSINNAQNHRQQKALDSLRLVTSSVHLSSSHRTLSLPDWPYKHMYAQYSQRMCPTDLTEITGRSSQKGIGVTLLLSKPGFTEVYTIFVVTE